MKLPLLAIAAAGAIGLVLASPEEAQARVNVDIHLGIPVVPHVVHPPRVAYTPAVIYRPHPHYYHHRHYRHHYRPHYPGHGYHRGHDYGRRYYDDHRDGGKGRR